MNIQNVGQSYEHKKKRKKKVQKQVLSQGLL